MDNEPTERKLDNMHADVRARDERIARVEAQLVEILARLPAAQATSPHDLLRLAEAARLLAVMPRTLRDGKAGTHLVPRQSSRPLLYLRADVERFIRNRAETKQAQRQRAARKLEQKRARLLKPRKRSS